MRLPKLAAALLVSTLLFVPKTKADSLSVKIFAASVYNSNAAVMDSNLGISGYLIDSFESTTLLPGLSITLSGGVPTTTETNLPALFNGDTFSAFTTNQAWDGVNSVTNAIGNAPNSAFSPNNIANLTTFNYAPGTTAFGLGLSNFQSINPASPFFPITQHDLIVNGVNLGTLETLAGNNWTAGIVRNGYLLITDAGGSITSVGIMNVNQPPPQQDFLMFDHLAVAPGNSAPVPEPSSLALLCSGLGAVIALSLKKTVS